MTKMQHTTAGLIEVKLLGDGADVGTFSGHGAVFGNVDHHGDVIEPGAFGKSLKEWSARGKWPKMLLQHGGIGLTSDDMMPVGQWTAMSEDERGLKVEGRLFAMGTERGQYIYEGLKSGELDSLSIGYRVRNAKSQTRGGKSVRVLTDIELFEVSIVTFPANDRATISRVKALAPEELRELEDVLRDAGLSRADSVKAVSVFKKMLQRDAEDPTNTPRDEDVPDGADEVLNALKSMTDRTWAEVFRAA